MTKLTPPKCQHCDADMKKWAAPDDTTWTSPFQWVCFNDECPYFKKGWDWMMESQGVKASYRHRLDPDSEVSGPLPTWSYEAHKKHIIKD